MIEIKEKAIDELYDELNSEINKEVMQKSHDLDQSTIYDLNNLFSNSKTQTTIEKINDFNNNMEFNYDDFCELDDSLKAIQDNLNDIKAKVDMDIFFKDGYTLDINKFKEKFDKKKLRKKFPNFSFKRLKQLYEEPPKTLNPYYSDTEEILIDAYIFRKNLIGIVQMVLDHMDLVSVVTGGEGTGKSTHVSQLMYMCWWITKELGIVEYKFDIKEMFFNTLENLRLKEDDYFNSPFRIFTLDEGNELHRQNWKDEEVSTFFQRLRRERFNQRIKFICIPVLGELISNIVLSRVNFIYEMSNTSDIKTGSLNKGRVLFYVIPRGDKIYSPFHRRELLRGDIKSVLFDNLKDKNFLKGMDNSMLVKRYNCNGTWGFPESLYVKELKETNKTFQVKKGLKMTDTEAGYLYLARISLKAIGLDSKDVKYSTLNKFFSRLKRYFEDDPTRINKLEAIVKRKEEERVIKDNAKTNRLSN